MGAGLGCLVVSNEHGVSSVCDVETSWDIEKGAVLENAGIQAFRLEIF